MAKNERDEWDVVDPSQLDVADLIPPRVIAEAGQKWTRGYAMFFAKHMNDHTNELYTRALSSFFKYISAQNIALVDVSASNILTYAKFRTDKRRKDHLSLNSIRPHLSALREFFNSCVLAGALSANPAAAVKPPKQRRKHGTTPVIDAEEVSLILSSIELKNQAAYRDRAMIGVMAYCFYRISAVLSLKVNNYQPRKGVMWFVASEKGGNSHEMPVHPELQTMIDEHLKQADIRDKPEALMFPSSHGKSGRLNGLPYRRNSAWEMVRRRASAAGVNKAIGNHSFRATGITTYMQLGGKLEKAQMLAGHAHISTTKLYDRSEDEDKVEEIFKLNF